MASSSPLLSFFKYTNIAWRHSFQAAQRLWNLRSPTCVLENASWYHLPLKSWFLFAGLWEGLYRWTSNSSLKSQSQADWQQSFHTAPKRAFLWKIASFSITTLDFLWKGSLGLLWLSLNIAIATIGFGIGLGIGIFESPGALWRKYGPAKTRSFHPEAPTSLDPEAPTSRKTDPDDDPSSSYSKPEQYSSSASPTLNPDIFPSDSPSFGSPSYGPSALSPCEDAPENCSDKSIPNLFAQLIHLAPSNQEWYRPRLNLPGEQSFYSGFSLAALCLQLYDRIYMWDDPSPKMSPESREFDIKQSLLDLNSAVSELLAEWELCSSGSSELTGELSGTMTEILSFLNDSAMSQKNLSLSESVLQGLEAPYTLSVDELAQIMEVYSEVDPVNDDEVLRLLTAIDEKYRPRHYKFLSTLVPDVLTQERFEELMDRSQCVRVLKAQIDQTTLDQVESLLDRLTKDVFDCLPSWRDSWKIAFKPHLEDFFISDKQSLCLIFQENISNSLLLSEALIQIGTIDCHFLDGFRTLGLQIHEVATNALNTIQSLECDAKTRYTQRCSDKTLLLSSAQAQCVPKPFSIPLISHEEVKALCNAIYKSFIEKNMEALRTVVEDTLTKPRWIALCERAHCKNALAATVDKETLDCIQQLRSQIGLSMSSTDGEFLLEGDYQSVTRLFQEPLSKDESEAQRQASVNAKDTELGNYCALASVLIQLDSCKSPVFKDLYQLGCQLQDHAEGALTIMREIELEQQSRIARFQP